MLKQLKLSVNDSDEFHSLDEEDYLQELKQYMEYDDSDELYVELLAFQETLMKAHQLLQEGKNVILTYTIHGRKKMILDRYLKRYENIIFREID